MTTIDYFTLTVPGTELGLAVDGSELVHGSHRFARGDHGIWDLTDPMARPTLDVFAADYVAVREAEGRSLEPDDVRRLPDTDAAHPLAAMWSQRARSWRRLESELRSVRVGTAIDIGAGCGWLAAHLAAKGWACAALDIAVEGGDGLAAARHHEQELLLARADMVALPFAADTVDLAVFNASLHYSSSVETALNEAQRVLRPGGVLAVLDSPVFVDPNAGAQMVHEFERAIQRQFGIEPAIHQGSGYVTWGELAPYAFTRHEPGSALRRQFHRWRGARAAGREVAERPLLIAQKPSHLPSSTGTRT